MVVAPYHVYIMASRSRVFYVGVTGDLRRRVDQHKSGAFEGFTKTHRVERLVYYESHRYILNAIAREKELKKWSRRKKISLIERQNPQWNDLAPTIHPRKQTKRP